MMENITVVRNHFADFISSSLNIFNSSIDDATKTLKLCQPFMHWISLLCNEIVPRVMDRNETYELKSFNLQVNNTSLSFQRSA